MDPIPLVCFPLLSLKQRRPEELQITAGDVAEIAYAILCSATSFLSEMAPNDASQAGHWFRGGAVFSVDHPGVGPLDQLMIEYDREEARRRREECQEFASHLDDKLKYGSDLTINLFCALRMILTVQRLAQTIFSPLAFLIISIVPVALTMAFQQRKLALGCWNPGPSLDLRDPRARL